MTVSVLFAKVFAGLWSVAMARLWVFFTAAAVLVPLERLIPRNPGQRLFRRSLMLDLTHFYVGGIITVVFTVLSYKALMWATGGRILAVNVRDWPWWAQFLAFELGWSFLGYWFHRLAHDWAPLWRLHSVHESIDEIDWLSSYRLHPIEPALFQIVTILPLYLIGASLPLVLAYKLWSYVMSHVHHANIRYSLGPLDYILPSPRFHRWHHARIVDGEGRKLRNYKNFSQYPFWDALFGTLYLPAEDPVAYGNADNVPQTYLGQLAYPFRRTPSRRREMSQVGGNVLTSRT